MNHRMYEEMMALTRDAKQQVLSSSSDPGKMDGEDESLHWLLTFHQPLALLQLMMLCQLQEVQILRTVGRKSPGGSMPWGN